MNRRDRLGIVATGDCLVSQFQVKVAKNKQRRSFVQQHWNFGMVNGDFFDLKQHIRSVPGWPEPHVNFRDICSLLKDKYFFRKSIDLFIHRYFNLEIDAVVGIDARGFIIGAPIAYELNAGFIPVRKKGKLPGETISESYTLEYGTAEIEMQKSALQRGSKVLLIDDLIATGGTMLAASTLLGKLGVEIIEAAAIIDLPDLGGSNRLREAGLTVHTFCGFEGE